MPNGKLYQSGDIPDPEFLHDAAPVGFDCLGGKEELFSNDRAGSAINDKVQNLPFPPAKAFQRGLSAGEDKIGEAVFIYFPAQIPFIAVGGPDGVNQFPADGLLQHVAPGPGGKGMEDMFAGRVDGQDESRLGDPTPSGPAARPDICLR